FHVDTTKYRRWNMDPTVASQCPPIVRPVVIAAAKQPAAQADSKERAEAESVTPPAKTANPPPPPAATAPPPVDPLAP
ncbi:hypothetical protein NPN13_25205, partial [Vibrio parahaemolyticus]|nr:hypothetical protein [Vibrio parahaemolyticus]